ncbi:BAG family molecular chaperone regulator 6-like [Vicia villosa]|uniref:BAG family molecular chaperone regulator 6-like n=1 Tax=Vicia villosa TaxID=3911 RepID=UPI00273ACC57|nr:BAG family molecular chaperone regulator 6-like [Vicia villosa]
MMHFNNNNKRTLLPFSSYETQWGAPRYNKTPSKVVSIPVLFVGSEKNRTASATKIQRVARGYLVRKSMKKMLKMKVELEEIDKKVNNEETVKMMKNEQKERIRIGETIMNLLLRLDCVRVFHCSALREFRKSLIRRAVFLQEFVDQIQMVSPTDEVEDVEGECDVVEENCLEREEVGCEDEHVVNGQKTEVLENEDGEGKVNCMEKEEGGYEVENEGGEKMKYLVSEHDGEGKCVKEEENCLMKVKEKEDLDEDEKKMEVEESVGSSLVEKGIEEGGVDVKEEEGRNVIVSEELEEDENREILRRMMDDNEKMMYMMTQLFERNEKQTSLLTSLTQRVEHLERAFTCDKLKKKNKRRRHVDAKHRYNGCI